jgi:hypothetical protein
LSHIGKKHEKGGYLEDFCDHWKGCKCGNEICLNCGSIDINRMDKGEEDDDASYWCCLYCENCGITGCGHCR